MEKTTLVDQEEHRQPDNRADRPLVTLGFGHSRNKKSEEVSGPEGLEKAGKKLSPQKKSLRE